LFRFRFTALKNGTFGKSGEKVSLQFVQQCLAQSFVATTKTHLFVSLCFVLTFEPQKIGTHSFVRLDSILLLCRRRRQQKKRLYFKICSFPLHNDVPQTKWHPSSHGVDTKRKLNLDKKPEKRREKVDDHS
jgi:hypothetical protein